MTGATGFIGRPLLARLSARGASLLGFSRNAEAEPPVEGVRYHRGDMKDPSALDQILDALAEGGSSRRAVIHLAGSALVSEDRRDPYGVYLANVWTMRALLERCRARNLRRFLYSSTAQVYGGGDRQIYREEDVPVPNSYYAATKLTAEYLLREEAERAGLSCDALRISNAYGARSRNNTVLGVILDQARAGARVELQRLRPVRDYIHVEDVAEGISLLVPDAAPGYRVVNISTGQGTSVEGAARMVGEILGKRLEIRQTEETSGDERDRIVLDNTVFRARTGLAPRDLRTGLAQVLGA